MVFREVMEGIRRMDAFNIFWRYPERRNLSKIYARLGAFRSLKDLRSEIRAMCSLVFESNEEGSFIYAEAANLQRYTEVLIEKALSGGVYVDHLDAAPPGRQSLVYREDGSGWASEPLSGDGMHAGDLNKFASWESSVTDVLMMKYKGTLDRFTEGLNIDVIEEHKKVVLYE